MVMFALKAYTAYAGPVFIGYAMLCFRQFRYVAEEKKKTVLRI